MLLDFDLRSCSRKCHATERMLESGETYFSLLEQEGHEIVRRDYCVEAWPGPPEDCLGWWHARLPDQQDARPQLAPNEVMLRLFEALESNDQECEFRYVLGLLLLRRRVLRKEGSTIDDSGKEVLQLVSRTGEQTFSLQVTEPPAERVEALHQRMMELLYGNDSCETESDQSEE